MPCRSSFHVPRHLEPSRLALAIGFSFTFMDLAASEVLVIHASGDFHSEVGEHSHSDVEQDQLTANWGRVAGEDVVTSAIEERVAGKKTLIRSGNKDSMDIDDDADEDPSSPPVQEIFSAPAGVVPGACANFRKTGVHEVIVSCPKDLKMVGCSCRDKVGENSGACGTKFSPLETCSAFTMASRSITAYVRCCHLNSVTGFSIQTSRVTEGGDGKSVEQGCPSGKTLLGCACLPADAPNNGCKHTQVKENTCMATNFKDHAKGVKAQALCADLPGTASTWETVSSPTFVMDSSTNLSCSSPDIADLHMISCSCGSDTGQCNGGKVLGNRCECSGKRCFASARCAKIHIPGMDCHWNHWGEWSDCSKSCGEGTRSRVREIAMIAMNGGSNCDGSAQMTSTCEGDGTVRECHTHRTGRSQLLEDNKWKIIILSGIGFAACLIGGALGGKYYLDKSRKAAPPQNLGDGQDEQPEYFDEQTEYFDDGDYADQVEPMPSMKKPPAALF